MHSRQPNLDNCPVFMEKVHVRLVQNAWRSYQHWSPNCFYEKTNAVAFTGSFRKDANMIIDATKMAYFKGPERAAFDDKAKKRKSRKSKMDDVGVIIDASEQGQNRRRSL